MNQETDMLKQNLKNLSSKNESLQTEFLGTVTENYQAQVGLYVKLHLLKRNI